MAANPDEDTSERNARPGEELALGQRQTWTLMEQTTNPALYQLQPLVGPALSAPNSLEASQWPNSGGPASGEDDLERPPPGCAPDAIKLFVGSIPKSYTESQLLPFFETIGKVVDLVIVRDKLTRESKGSAFLWYATRAHAEVAILQFNLRHVLPNPTGEHNRPLVLRRAKLRTQAQARQSPASTSSLSTHSSQLPQYSHSSGGQYHQGMAPLSGSRSQPYGPGTSHAILLSDMMQMQAHGGGHGYQGGMQVHGHQGHQGSLRGQGHQVHGQHSQLPPQPQRSYVHVTPFGVPGNPGGSGYGDYGHDAGGPSSMEDMDAMVLAFRNAQVSRGQGGTGAPNVTEAHVATRMSGPPALQSVAMDLTAQQLGLVNDYMHSVQNISGAKLTISVGNAPGIFRLSVSGAETQVEAAKTLLASVIQQQH